jgi:N-acetylmuramoyl-L-alanine amidase
METIKKGSQGAAVKQLQAALHLSQDGIFGRITEEAVRDFQRKNGLKADGIVGDVTWAKLLGNIDKLKMSSRRINEIIVHCSATREGRDYTVADITKWHKQRGFNDIGYHYVIYRDGSIHNGRDVNLVGAHCTNHNAHSIGVCYIGGCKTDGTSPKDTRTDAQKAALLSLLKDLRKKYPFAKIHGHRDFANKACPSFDATNEYKNI